MEKVIIGTCFQKKVQLIKGIHLLQVPSIGDFMDIPNHGVLRVEHLEWQVKRIGELVDQVHIYGDIVSPPYRI